MKFEKPLMIKPGYDLYKVPSTRYYCSLLEIIHSLHPHIQLEGNKITINQIPFMKIVNVDVQDLFYLIGIVLTQEQRDEVLILTEKLVNYKKQIDQLVGKVRKIVG